MTISWGNRGQASLEYITSYAWAFLIILVALGVLVYFGVIDVKGLAPDSCSIEPSFSCKEYSLQSEGIALFRVANNMRSDIIFQSVNCIFEDGNTVDVTASTTLGEISSGDTWPAGQNIEVKCVCDNKLATSKKARMSFEIAYLKKEGGFTHTIEGKITANAVG